MLSEDDALKVGLARYRELYPSGVVPKEIESHATFTVKPGKVTHVVLVCYWIKGEDHPLVFFEAEVNRSSEAVNVLKSEQVESVIDLDLVEEQAGLTP